MRTGATTVRRGAAALAVAILTLGALTVAAVPASATPASDVIYPATNSYRSSKGVPALKWSTATSRVATQWSTKMLSSRKLSHNPHYGSQMPQSGLTSWGENVAYACGYGGEAANATKIMDMWKKSPGHNANLLRTSFTHIGVGTAYDKSSDCLYATQDFGGYVSGTPANFYKSPVPTISGKARVGATLTATRGQWSPVTGSTFAFRWYANGAAISKATGKYYTLKPADAGKRITVKVTATRPGFVTVKRTSAATATIVNVP